MRAYSSARLCVCIYVYILISSVTFLLSSFFVCYTYPAHSYLLFLQMCFLFILRFRFLYKYCIPYDLLLYRFLDNIKQTPYCQCCQNEQFSLYGLLTGRIECLCGLARRVSSLQKLLRVTCRKKLLFPLPFSLFPLFFIVFSSLRFYFRREGFFPG